MIFFWVFAIRHFAILCKRKNASIIFFTQSTCINPDAKTACDVFSKYAISSKIKVFVNLCKSFCPDPATCSSSVQ